MYIPHFMSYNHCPYLKTSFHQKNDMKWFDAGTKNMSVSTFGSFIKLMKLPCTAAWVSPRDRAAADYHNDRD